MGLILNNKERMGELPSGDVDDSAPLQCKLGAGISVESHQQGDSMDIARRASRSTSRRGEVSSHVSS